jgi:hypothetical protein
VRLDREETGGGGVLRRYIQANRPLPIVTVTVDSVVYLRGIRGVRKAPWTLRGAVTPPMLWPDFVDQALQRPTRPGRDLRARSLSEGFSSLDPGEEMAPTIAAPSLDRSPPKRKRKARQKQKQTSERQRTRRHG